MTWFQQHPYQGARFKYFEAAYMTLYLEKKVVESLYSGRGSSSSSSTKKNTGMKPRNRELVRLCSFPPFSDSECKDMFYHIPTLSGICSSFQGESVLKVRDVKGCAF